MLIFANGQLLQVRIYYFRVFFKSYDYCPSCNQFLFHFLLLLGSGTSELDEADIKQASVAGHDDNDWNHYGYENNDSTDVAVPEHFISNTRYFLSQIG